ncbi:Alpha/Beta hydrolase protein [Apiospora phragmitis]|uniref:Alpha/Beta hydrolase protein n=1 Tax=Apiospora phragmitis TaxID=2905665 RepID=A0ABR1W5I9_9PEZI
MSAPTSPVKGSSNPPPAQQEDMGLGGLVLTHADLKLKFKASFSEAVTKFTIDVHEPFLTTTKLKASFTRYVDDLVDDDDQPVESTDGPPRRIVEKVAQYWAERYDWRAVEADLNARLPQYTTLVKTPGTGFTDPIPLHFVHKRSPRPDAIPLLFLHGWPGSFLEVDPILEPLTNPESADQPAFHVVAPSIPGYGFSPAPRRAGMGYRQAAAAFAALMRRLGYDKYVWQGGDAGDFIGHFLALDFPDQVVSGHSNFWVVPPTPEDQERRARHETTEDEDFVMARLGRFVDVGWSYGQIQQTKPLKLAAGLTDSPVGLAMWIYDACAGVVADPETVFAPERLITWTMMHWIPGPYAAFSLYKNGRKLSKADRLLLYLGRRHLHQGRPVDALRLAAHGHLAVPLDLWYRTPLEWAKRTGNVVACVRHDRGGHFAALDAPDLLVGDVRAFFGDRELSGTQVFVPPPVRTRGQSVGMREWHVR